MKTLAMTALGLILAGAVTLNGAATANAATLDYSFDLSQDSAAATATLEDLTVEPVRIEALSAYATVPKLRGFEVIQYGASSSLTVNDCIALNLGVDGSYADGRNALSGFGEISAESEKLGTIKIRGEFPQNSIQLDYATPTIKLPFDGTLNGTIAAKVKEGEAPSAEGGITLEFGSPFQLTGSIQPDFSKFKDSGFSVKVSGSFEF